MVLCTRFFIHLILRDSRCGRGELKMLLRREHKTRMKKGD